MQEAQELGSALGYLLLYLELAASYLGAPLLNQVPLIICHNKSHDAGNCRDPAIHRKQG